jgi:hypothetical protein
MHHTKTLISRLNITSEILKFCTFFPHKRAHDSTLRIRQFLHLTIQIILRVIFHLHLKETDICKCPIWLTCWYTYICMCLYIYIYMYMYIYINLYFYICIYIYIYIYIYIHKYVYNIYIYIYIYIYILRLYIFIYGSASVLNLYKTEEQLLQGTVFFFVYIYMYIYILYAY